MGLLEAGDAPEVWFEPQPTKAPGFELRVRWMNPDRADKLGEMATERKRRRGTIEEKLDRRMLSELMISEMIVDWRGATAENLGSMMPLTPTAAARIKREYPDGIPFSKDDLKTLTRTAHAKEFLEDVMDMATDFSTMRAAAEAAALGNSEGSSPTTATPSGPSPAETATS